MMTTSVSSNKPIFLWAYGLFEGKPMQIGPFGELEEDKLHSKATEKGMFDYKIFKLTTRNSGEAVRRIRYLLTEEGVPLKDAIKKMKKGMSRQEEKEGWMI